MEDTQNLADRVRASMEQGKRAEEIFEMFYVQINQDPETHLALVETLGATVHPEAARLLLRILEVSEDKVVRKAVKRSLYRLKAKGIRSEDIATDKGRSILRPLTVDPSKGFGGPIDPSGQRILLLAVPHPGRGWVVMQGVVSDRMGLVGFSGGEIGRKAFRSLLEEVCGEGPAPVVEVDASHVAFLFSQAYELTLSRESTPPQEYAPFKAEVEKLRKGAGRPPIYAHLKEEDVREDDRLLRKVPDLLKTDLFLGWGIEEERVGPYAEAVREAGESKLVLTPVQKEARVQEILQRAVTEWFGDEERRLYKKRMEEMAYYLLKRGREDEARVSLAVALDLDKPPTTFQRSPFLFHLVTQSVQRILNGRRAEQSKEPSFIVKP